MKSEAGNETFEDRLVTYAVEVDGKFFLVEKVPARVCLETGEQLFSPETVERLHCKILGSEQPKRVVETPVYEFSA